uniref:Retrovirus-related Pol polyprotein from transposon RE1 n=1 Tax=Vitis vinifera TaxID=29760 RepID=A5CB12_VITVI|nr:hypothetical protein VITISV_010713 [Vitis vinifera]
MLKEDILKVFQFELFLKGKELWGHIDGTDVEKPSTFDKSQDVGSSPSRVVLDAHIMSWLLGLVEPHIVTHLRLHRSAQSMWAYLKKVYHQDNDARRFQLEHAIAMFQHTNVPIAVLSTIQTIHATTQRDQFLMKLCPEYESVHSSLLNRSTVLCLDIFFGELLREEQCLSTQAILEQSHGSSGTATVAYAAQRRGPPMHSKNLQCFCCKEYGHIAATCPKKFCSYYKKGGHIIKECRIRPQNHYYTSEMVQQMLISALSAMGLQGNNSTKLWYVDSGASNHMTNNPTALCHVRPYAGQSSIQTANGNSLPITAIDNASSKFTDVFLASHLSTNLISVGQLVDNNCTHRRLGHPNTQILSHVLNSDLPGNKDRSSLSLECDSCKFGKSKTLPFPLHASRASHCFDLIHSDVWEPSPVSSHEKFKYYVTFIDDHSRFTWVYFLRSKSEVFRTFTKFLAYVDNLFSTSIQTLCTDFDGEYLFTEFQAFMSFYSSTKWSCRTQKSSSPRCGTYYLQFSDLHPVSSRFQLGIVYTRRSRPQSLSVAHPIFDPITLQIQSVAVPPAPLVRRFPRVSVPPNRYGFPFSSSGNSISTLTAGLSNFDIPTCYSYAAKHDCWPQAMQEEIATLEANHTWDIELSPPTIVPLGCKWVYLVKVRYDGSLDRYKAWLVALGNNQEYGVNYEETFAPVAKMTTVRTILVLAASSDWPLHQMDVKK